jgi:hypothetical protein
VRIALGVVALLACLGGLTPMFTLPVLIGGGS